MSERARERKRKVERDRGRKGKRVEKGKTASLGNFG